MNEQALQALMNLIRNNNCEVTYEVKKNPQGVHIIIDVTKEEMDKLIKQAKAPKK